MRKGLLYAVSDAKWARETFTSALSAKRTMPDLERQLYTTKAVLDCMGKNEHELFTEIIEIKDSSIYARPKLDALIDTKLDYVISVDSDTYFIEPIYELLEIPNSYDLAGVIAPQLLHPNYKLKKIDKLFPKLSDAVPEINTGLLVYKQNDEIRKFFTQCLENAKICFDNNYTMDQAGFRSALATSNIRFCTLPDIYNFRANMTHFVRHKIKVLHAHGELKELGALIKKQKLPFLYQPPKELVHGYKPKGA